MVDYGRKLCSFSFKGICRPKTNNREKCLIFFVTVLLFVEEWLVYFHNVINAIFFLSEMLLKMGENDGK